MRSPHWRGQQLALATANECGNANMAVEQENPGVHSISKQRTCYLLLGDAHGQQLAAGIVHGQAAQVRARARDRALPRFWPQVFHRVLQYYQTASLRRSLPVIQSAPVPEIVRSPVFGPRCSAVCCNN